MADTFLEFRDRVLEPHMNDNIIFVSPSEHKEYLRWLKPRKLRNTFDPDVLWYKGKNKKVRVKNYG